MTKRTGAYMQRKRHMKPHWSLSFMEGLAHKTRITEMRSAMQGPYEARFETWITNMDTRLSLIDVPEVPIIQPQFNP